MIILTNERQVSDQIENPLEFLNYSINEAICTCFHEKNDNSINKDLKVYQV